MNWGIARLAAPGLLLLSLSTSQPAFAAYSFCSEPRAPSLSFITKPSKPYCATMRNCEQWEVDSYRSNVKRYFDRLQEYLADVESYQKEAYEYAKCMADLD
jgi:hypothetical protein